MEAKLVAAQQWVLPLGGTATDPGSGPTVSGIDRVEVLVDAPGGDWQVATITGQGTPNATWSIDYLLPDLSARRPNGAWQLEVRAFDVAGNETVPGTQAKGLLNVDNTPPVVGLNSVPSIITQPLTLSGPVSETETVQTGVQRVELSFTGDGAFDADRTASAVLAFEDPPGATQFADWSGQGRGATCIEGGCPTAGASGRSGGAVAFASGEQQVLQITNASVPTDAYTLVGWFKTTCKDCGLFSVSSSDYLGSGIDRQIYLDRGYLCSDVVTYDDRRETVCSPKPYGSRYYSGDSWIMGAQTVGPGGHRLYANGQLISQGEVTGSIYGSTGTFYIGRSDVNGLRYYEGNLDEVKVFTSELSERQIFEMYRYWQPVTVAGPGALDTTWSQPLPADLEGFFQIDLTATDALGNRNNDRVDWGKWQGEIDLVAPRVRLSATYLYENSTRLVGYAEDLNLTEEGLKFPCPPEQRTTKRFCNTLVAPDLPQRLNAIEVSCTVFGLASTPQTIQVCDIYGRCATTSQATPLVYNVMAPWVNGTYLADAPTTMKTDLVYSTGTRWDGRVGAGSPPIDIEKGLERTSRFGADDTYWYDSGGVGVGTRRFWTTPGGGRAGAQSRDKHHLLGGEQ